MKRPLNKYILLAALAVLVAAVPAQALSIEFRPEVSVRGDWITLQDVALVVDQSESRVLALYRLRLAASPDLGKTVEVRRRTIQDKLRPIIGPKNLALQKIPAVIYVTRERAALTRALIAERFRGFVYAHMPWPRDQVRIYGIRFRGDLNFPAGRVHITVVPVGHPTYRGDVALNFHLRIDDRLVKVLLVRGRVDVYSQVIVAARSVARGEVITAAAVRAHRVDQGRVPPGLATSAKQVIGLQALVALRPGQKIYVSQVRSPRLIRRGEEVTILVQKGGLRISAPGRALTDGHVGGRVAVMNLASRRKIMARVQSPGVVTVTF
jgi:flagella basal body P-ring formation protein FlgA